MIYFRDNHKCTVTGWGSSTTTKLQASDLAIIPQVVCDRKYNLTQDHDFYNWVQRELPNLFQDNLLCAAHDVSTYNKNK